MKQIKFDIEYDKKFSYSFGYALYAAFLEQISEELANEIHNDNIFNQYILPDKWIINSNIDIDFKEEYFLKSFNTNIKLKNKKIEVITEQDLADKFLVREPFKKNIRIKFQTPTTFKKDEEYVLFPTKDLIFQSLTNKWNNFAENFVLKDMNWENSKISRYNLRTVNYMIKGVKIQGFVGYVDIFFWGGESLTRLGNMICNFSNYSGIGIKTALGMGGALVE